VAGDYHTDVNIETNYWFVDADNSSETSGMGRAGFERMAA